MVRSWCGQFDGLFVDEGGGEVVGLKPKRVEGIEPSSLAWKAIALPLSYTRSRPASAHCSTAPPRHLQPDRLGKPKSLGSEPGQAGRDCMWSNCADGQTGECRIRTCEGISHQIYSLTPLTARETPLVVLVLVMVDG